MSEQDKKAAQLEGDINVLAARVVEAIQKAVEDLACAVTASGAGEALRQAGKAATGNLGYIADDARNLGGAGIDEISAAVRKNPLTWVAVAAGVGLILGLWKSRDTQS